MSTLITTPIARFDNRLRLAAILLRAAPRAEHLVVAGMTLASAAAAWPFAGALYPAVAVPAVLALAALIRHHLDGLGARREALVAAGADPGDTFVIQVAGPLGATWAGAVAGLGASAVLGRSPVPAFTAIAAGLAATLLIRRTWLGAPALATGSGTALATATLLRLSASPTAPVVEERSRTSVHHAVASASTWSAAWPTALAAVLTLTAVQLAIARRRQIRALARALTAAAARRLIMRSGA